MKKMRYIAAAGVTLVAAAGMLTACSSSSSGDSTGGSSGGDNPTINFALDWTVNTDHTGLYVAENKGYFSDAGVNINILPYNDAEPIQLVSTGAAQCGISFENEAITGIPAGNTVTSVLAVTQHWTYGIGVAASNTAVKSPKDLDGGVYAGFGTPS